MFYACRAKTMSAIKRVGIVLKPHQPEALKTICELVVWLAERNIKLTGGPEIERERIEHQDRKSTRLNSSHGYISYAVFRLKKKIKLPSGGSCKLRAYNLGPLTPPSQRT